LPYKEPNIEKVFYSIREVGEMFDLPASTLRYWEQEFPVLKPRRNKKGTRYYTKKDIDNLYTIYHLVKERGMTLKGARQKIRDNKEDLEQDTQVVKKLQQIREMLIRIRDEIV
jgi:DNA-binding transcriptional MerR regulator